MFYVCARCACETCICILCICMYPHTWMHTCSCTCIYSCPCTSIFMFMNIRNHYFVNPPSGPPMSCSGEGLAPSAVHSHPVGACIVCARDLTFVVWRHVLHSLAAVSPCVAPPRRLFVQWHNVCVLWPRRSRGTCVLRARARRPSGERVSRLEFVAAECPSRRRPRRLAPCTQISEPRCSSFVASLSHLNHLWTR